MPQLNLRRAGSGEPLLLIHGIGSDLHAWDPVFDALAAERDVIALDLPGFGASPALADGVEPSPARLAEALGELLDALDLGRAHLAGISLGGWVALELARQGRGLTATAICPAGLWGAPLLAREQAARNISLRAARGLLPLLRRLMLTDAGRRLALGRFVARPERLPPEEALRMLDAFVRAPAYEATNLAMRRRHFQGGERIRVPVTVAWGERDRVVQRSSRVPPGARVVDLPGCGHMATWDDPALVARVLLAGSSRRQPRGGQPDADRPIVQRGSHGASSMLD